MVADKVSAQGPAIESGLSAQLKGIATRLIDIAGCVASEAEMATAVVRGMTDQADQVASFAMRLEAAAGLIEEGVSRQVDALAVAKGELTTNRPVIDALEQSVASVTAISAAIASIARESRTLSLNARIEAARAGTESAAFAVVANQMSQLASRTKDATDEITGRACLIAHDVGAANAMAVAHEGLVLEQDTLLITSLEQASRQRAIAAALATITAETVETVDRAASAIGRVGANAVAVKVLARQLSKLSQHQD